MDSEQDEPPCSPLQAPRIRLGLHNSTLIPRTAQNSSMTPDMIKAQMTMDAAKKAIADKKEAVDKVKRASRIDDLITYAECCEAMAVQMLIEADIAMLTAAAEAADYVDTYGEEAELSE